MRTLDLTGTKRPAKERRCEMDSSQTIHVDALVAEIQAYLRVVDYFRSLGCEPRWRSWPYERGVSGGSHALLDTTNEGGMQC